MRRPGTHSSDEVKDLIHARARLRRFSIAALVVLVLISLLVIYNTSQEYENPDALPSKPKMVLFVAGDLSFPSAKMAERSGKLSFVRGLTHRGGVFGMLNAKYAAAGSGLVKLLTGSEDASSTTLSGQKSFLSVLKKNGMKPAIIASPQYWSATATDAEGQCSRIGIFDTECSGSDCPGKNEAAYCNAAFKYTTCEGGAQYAADNIVSGFRAALEAGADIIYIQVDGLSVKDEERNEAGNRTQASSFQLFSRIDLLDNMMWQVAMELQQRTKNLKENWLIMVSSEGQNRHYNAPVFIMAYSAGAPLLLNPISETATLQTTDIYHTILHWFDLKPEGRYDIGICSTGKSVKNCVVPPS